MYNKPKYWIEELKELKFYRENNKLKNVEYILKNKLNKS